ncbi:MAG: hypothetical protein CSA21_04205 [Deltaproteobacteria bacterium]|nr:MAG: hypothetical protein CSA21_04205 [Deltaproteobacteria bacterium]
MRKIFTGICGGAILFCGTTTLAKQPSIDLGVRAGTLGGGLEAGLGLSDNVNLRAGFNYLTFSFDTTISNIDYKMEPEFKNLSLLLDWHPFGGGFKVIGGVFINNNEIKVSGKPRRDTLWQDYTVPPQYNALRSLAETVEVNGSVDFNPVTPYLGLGWNSNVDREPGWGFGVELGVMFQGKPEVSTLTASAAPPLGYFADHPAVVLALEEEKQAIQNELDEFEYYPVAQFSINYTF